MRAHLGSRVFGLAIGAQPDLTLPLSYSGAENLLCLQIIEDVVMIAKI
jgi:hypothetical protein